MMTDRNDQLNRIAEVWPELDAADKAANGGGFAIDLLSAQMYAEQDGISLETYVIRTLRAERVRRQELDRIVSDKGSMRLMVEAARDAGMPVTEYVASKYGNNDIRFISADWLVKLANYLEAEHYDND